MSEKSTSNKRKVATTAAAVGLAALMLLGGGSFAYLRDASEEKVNTFDTNKVTVNLEESNQKYNIIPDTKETKDPKVTVDNTTDAYVYVEVDDNTQGLVTYEVDTAVWTALPGVPNVYYKEVAADAETKEFYVLKGNEVSYDKSLTNEDMANKENVSLSFKAIAMQKAPFNDPLDAYFQTDIDTVAVLSSKTTASEMNSTLSSAEGTVALVVSEDTVISDDIITIPENKTVLLDLSENSIATDGYQDRPIVNYGDLTVTGNGTIDTTDADGYGAIRNYGTLTIEDGTFKGNDLSQGSAIDTQSGGTTIINGGTYYATCAIMNRVGGTVILNGGDFSAVPNDNEKYSSGVFAYAIINNGDMTINGGDVHGTMNGGVACDAGTITINGGHFVVEKGTNSTYYVLVTNKANEAKIIVNDGIFEQRNGTDRLIGGFSGMPSWDATDDLEANGYTINGGTFILNGETVTVG